MKELNTEYDNYQEIWKTIPSAPSYEASSEGRIRSKERTLNCNSSHYKQRHFKGKILSQYITYNGYCLLHIRDKEGRKHTRYVHRLIAEAFIENPNEFMDVNHKNGNKRDNRVDNLEWCTRQYNIRHAFKMGLNKITESQKQRQRKRVDITFPDGTIYVADSVLSASKIMGYRHSNSLCRALKINSFNMNGIKAKYHKDI